MALNPLKDTFCGKTPDWSAPGVDGFDVTKSDTTNDPNGPFRCLYVGGSGNVKVRTFKGNDVTFSSVPAGTFLPIAVLFVFSTGTTATAIVGLV